MNESLEQPNAYPSVPTTTEYLTGDIVIPPLGISTYEQAKPFAIDEHVADLRKQLAAEREAREKAEARYGCARELIQKLLNARSPDVPIEECSAMIHHAQVFLSSAKPPALLKEVERLRVQLEQEKQWKIEDPRMLREQIRVADVAFQSLHERHKAAEANLALATDALHTYGNHTAICRSTLGIGMSCDCGWNEVLAKLNQ